MEASWTRWAFLPEPGTLFICPAESEASEGWLLADGKKKGRKLEKQRDKKKKKERLLRERSVGCLLWNEEQEVLDLKEANQLKHRPGRQPKELDSPA